MGEEYRDIVRGFLRDHIPALAAAPIDLAETCLYTVAPDEQFVVDFLPGRADVIVASPCSGHGFKFSCLIGKVLAELATTGESENRDSAVEADRRRTSGCLILALSASLKQHTPEVID